MQSYDDNVRKADFTRINVRGKEAVEMMSAAEIHNALAVLILSGTLRPVLEALDPKAVEQARRALLLIN